MQRDDDRPRPPGFVGPPARQIDDTAVKPSAEQREVNVTFYTNDHARRALSAFSAIGHVRVQEGPPLTLSLMVDQNGMKEVERLARDLQGQVRTDR